jgi:hypothetical protein
MASYLIDNGIAIFRYADDTFLWVTHDYERAVNLKLSLYTFELMSGLKINLFKSENFTIGGDDVITKY